MSYWIIVIVLVVVAAVVAGAALLRPRFRRGRAPGAPPQPPAPPGASSAPPRAPGETAGTAAPPVAPPGAGPPPTEAEAAPPPLAGRMARLRGRLARSQSGFGAVLLSLLSRDGLDEQGWEEIEDTLVSADLGVGPARQIVQELRTQVRVGGTQGAEHVRALL